jgi:hypothetical protein
MNDMMTITKRMVTIMMVFDSIVSTWCVKLFFFSFFFLYYRCCCCTSTSTALLSLLSLFLNPMDLLRCIFTYQLLYPSWCSMNKVSYTSFFLFFWDFFMFCGMSDTIHEMSTTENHWKIIDREYLEGREAASGFCEGQGKQQAQQ